MSICQPMMKEKLVFIILFLIITVAGEHEVLGWMSLGADPP